MVKCRGNISANACVAIVFGIYKLTKLLITWENSDSGSASGRAGPEGRSMGVRIDRNVLDTVASRGAQNNYVARVTKRAAVERYASEGVERQARREQIIEAGFGENTVSVPGVTIRTLNRNLVEARKAVPSTEALREEAAARVEERREAIRERITPPDIAERLQETAARRQQPPEVQPQAAAPDNRPRPPEPARPEPVVQRVRPEAAPQARNFATQAAQPQPAEPPPRQEPRSPAPGAPVTPARLDVLV